MKVNKINIKNFRALVDESFQFNEQFTVLIGDNGAGKTSILDALAKGFFSIWMHAFKEYPEVQEALIDNFPGTKYKAEIMEYLASLANKASV